MKLKVCGMKSNTKEVAELQPDYLGFIFWEPSVRFFDGQIPSLPLGIKKVGVFVDASVEEVLEKVERYDLWGVQLHGDESPEYCKQLKVKCQTERSRGPILIKVFSIKDNFDFSILEPYEKLCDYYLFDTKGKLPGGNGYTFNWGVLKDYPTTKPYFLSGGIGLGEMASLKEFMKRPESKYCHVVDVNSRFEIEPGLKDVEELKEFKKVLSTKY
mgnify:CR=1 FL=1